MVRWTPWGELEEMTDPLNRFVAHPETRRSNGKEVMPVGHWAVSGNIIETDGEFHIKTEFPGLKNETVRVTLDEGMFPLQGEQKAN